MKTTLISFILTCIISINTYAQDSTSVDTLQGHFSELPEFDISVVVNKVIDTTGTKWNIYRPNTYAYRAQSTVDNKGLLALRIQKGQFVEAYNKSESLRERIKIANVRVIEFILDDQRARGLRFAGDPNWPGLSASITTGKMTIRIGGTVMDKDDLLRLTVSTRIMPDNNEFSMREAIQVFTHYRADQLLVVFKAQESGL
jgi:hypothetical protein